jgi:hypothetical protein
LNRNSKYWILVFYRSRILHRNLILHELHNFRIFLLDEVYRFLIIRPSDLKWKFVQYNEKRTELICSDPERLPVPRHPPVDVQGMRSPWLNSCTS